MLNSLVKSFKSKTVKFISNNLVFAHLLWDSVEEKRLIKLAYHEC